MTEYTIAFPFGDEDEFQTIVWEFADGQLSVNGDPVKGLDYVIGYGLKQALADSWSSHAKAKDYDKASDAFSKRLIAIVEGTIAAGTRASNPIGVEIFRLARLAVDKAVKAKYKDRKGFEAKKGKGAYGKAVKAYVQKHATALKAQAETNLESAKALADVDI